jgi:hypothetical protein
MVSFQIGGKETKDYHWKLPGRSLKRKRPDRNPASCKIQYPMKNRDKDVGVFLIFKTYFQNIFFANDV